MSESNDKEQAAVSESKTPEIRVESVTTAYGAVQFRHLLVALRGLAFVLALSSRGRPTPFDEERKDALEAIREAFSRPLSEGQLADLSTLRAEREALQRENQALRNLANNLQPGPISEALAGERYTRESELKAECERLRKLFREIDEYLSGHPQNALGCGSKLHRDIQSTLRPLDTPKCEGTLTK